MKIEAGKEYFTREGKRVRILFTDLYGQYPILGVTEEAPGRWAKVTWTLDGVCCHSNPSPMDLAESKAENKTIGDLSLGEFFWARSVGGSQPEVHGNLFFVVLHWAGSKPSEKVVSLKNGDAWYSFETPIFGYVPLRLRPDAAGPGARLEERK